MYMRTEARAKINLYLDVGSVRDDGFHEIRSIMHETTLCDYVSCTGGASKDRRIKISVDDESIPTDERNLVWRAAEAFFRHFRIDGYDVTFEIEKNIPHSAGLAGGSADAAATILLLDRIFGCGASTAELCEIGAEIGSDVPFCIVGGTCAVEGRGEKLCHIDSALRFNFVIAKGGEGVSTPKAYSLIDDMNKGAAKLDERAYDEMKTAAMRADGEAVVSMMHNSFEAVVLPIRDEAAAAKRLMTEYGASRAMLSGSGPSVFGIFDSPEDADRAACELRLRGYAAHACFSASRAEKSTADTVI